MRRTIMSLVGRLSRAKENTRNKWRLRASQELWTNQSLNVHVTREGHRLQDSTQTPIPTQAANCVFTSAYALYLRSVMDEVAAAAAAANEAEKEEANKAAVAAAAANAQQTQPWRGSPAAAVGGVLAADAAERGLADGHMSSPSQRARPTAEGVRSVAPAVSRECKGRWMERNGLTRGVAQWSAGIMLRESASLAQRLIRMWPHIALPLTAGATTGHWLSHTALGS